MKKYLPIFKMKTIVSTSLISFLILSVLLGIFGFGLSHSMMSLLQTPADILDEAVLYLRVYFVGFPFLFMYNILSTMFTSIGESKIPLVLLDIFFCLKYSDGSLDGCWLRTWRVWCSSCNLDCTGDFSSIFIYNIFLPDASV